MSELVFDEEKHRYYLDGLKLLGINEIIQLAGLSSYKGISASKLDYSRTKGKYIHSATSLWDSGELDWNTLDETIRPYVECWRDFLVRESIEIIDNELKMYSQKLLIAGTVDRIFKWKGKLWICDIKTGEAIKPETILQLAGYQVIANEQLKLNIKNRVTIRITPTMPEIEKHTDESDTYDFLAALRTVRFGLNHNLIKQEA